MSAIVVNGSADFNTAGVSPVTRSGTLSKTCDDVIGNFGGQNPLTLVSSRNYLWEVEGRSNSGKLSWNYHSYPFGPAASTATYASLTTSPSDNQALAEGLAKTNPSKPVVDLPLFVFELRDLPRMLRDWGDIIQATRFSFKNGRRFGDLKDLPRFAAQRHLEYQFAIAPFIGDLMRMMDFQAQTEKRIRMLKNLKSGAIVRSATVWGDDGVVQPEKLSYVSSLYQESNRLAYRLATRRRMWVSTKWTATRPLPDTDMELRALANKLVFGLDTSFSLLWNAMPWTWLVDWFSNIGDIVDGARNTIPCAHTGSCIMLHRKTVIDSWRWVSRPSSSTIKLRIADSVNEHKLRWLAPTVALPEFDLPFLDGRQLSILSALAVTRR